MTVSHATTVQVHWSDADPAGIAFYPRFFEWYDRGSEALFASVGLGWPELFPKYALVGVPILESGSRFRSPARYGDTLTVHSTLAWVKEKTFRVEHRITLGERLCAEGFEVRAWIPRPAPGADLATAPIPPEVVARLTGGRA